MRNLFVILAFVCASISANAQFYKVIGNYWEMNESNQWVIDSKDTLSFWCNHLFVRINNDQYEVDEIKHVGKDMRLEYTLKTNTPNEYVYLTIYPPYFELYFINPFNKKETSFTGIAFIDNDPIYLK
jgi:hypothetical protein